MKKKFALMTALAVLILCSAQDSYDDFREQLNQQQKDYINQKESEFQKYHLEHDSLFIQHKEAIEKLWNEFRESTPTDWVSYNEDFSGRSEVSFESGSIRIDAVIDTDAGQTEQQAKEIIKKQIVSILKEKDSSETPILKDQVKNPLDDQKTIDDHDVDKIAENIAQNAISKKITGADNHSRSVFSINLELIPDHLSKRAGKYKPVIEKYCQIYQIDPRLALAIAHTESFFNPKAYNRHGNAYGMMQIVPKYAGLTMNNALFKKNQQPSSHELFNPDINIHMGIGYLRWLADNKWADVKNIQNQTFCLICSYNGGPGTIYKAMTGKMKNIGDKWKPMFDDLNKMNSQKLFDKLRRDVPYEETRNYIKKVHERMNNEYAKVTSP
jgi:membrane-bound lytic murein transglycosylase C